MNDNSLKNGLSSAGLLNDEAEQEWLKSDYTYSGATCLSLCWQRWEAHHSLHRNKQFKKTSILIYQSQLEP